MGLDAAIFIVFLGCVAAIQAWLPPRGRVALLFCASLAFYAASDPAYLPLLLGLCALNYRAASNLDGNRDPRHRDRIFASTVIVNLAVLLLFKYSSATFSQWMARQGWIGPGDQAINLTPPLGLSYFTFAMLACLTDVYRGAWRMQPGFARFSLFGLFFPQISSGPIPRVGRLWPQLAQGGAPSAGDRLAGIRLIALGLFKKYAVANRLNEYVAPLFKDRADATTPVLLACCLNALQLYADFSGYIDIALGSAGVLGIHLDPNFDHPFRSTSVTEFWRRWHMTLAFWVRDYLYMPLLVRIRNLGKLGVIIALLVTFAVVGLWHGATWPFFLFGVSQGLALCAEFLTRQWRTKRLKLFPANAVEWAGRFYTLGFFVLSQVLFRSPTLTQALWVYGRLFRFRGLGNLQDIFKVRPFFLALDCLAIGAWIGLASLQNRTTGRATPWYALLCGLLILFLGHLGVAHFIYAAF